MRVYMHVLSRTHEDTEIRILTVTKIQLPPQKLRKVLLLLLLLLLLLYCSVVIFVYFYILVLTL
jgi:hypothetical protein